MWALILAVQLEMRFFQALTVNTVGVLELHWKQLGHIIKPGATDKHQVLWRFFYLGFFWCSKNLGQVGVLPVGTDNPRKQNTMVTIPSLNLAPQPVWQPALALEIPPWFDNSAPFNGPFHRA